MMESRVFFFLLYCLFVRIGRISVGRLKNLLKQLFFFSFVLNLFLLHVYISNFRIQTYKKTRHIDGYFMSVETIVFFIKDLLYFFLYISFII